MTKETEKEVLWMRKMSCGHSRPTNIAFLMNNYKKPEVGTKCFCKECYKEVEIIEVTECKDRQK